MSARIEPGLRRERPGDRDAIARIVTAAFAGDPHSLGNEARIVEALREADALAVSLVAVHAGSVVGHVACSPVTVDGRDTGWQGLGPVTVDPGVQRAGIGVALVRAALAGLDKHGASGCVVLGDPAYYRRFGFVPEPKLRYAGAPPEYFMALGLAARIPTGTVRYHRAFEVS